MPKTEGFPCLDCYGPTRVAETRMVRTSAYRYRRHECRRCGFRFTTWEVTDRPRLPKLPRRPRGPGMPEDPQPREDLGELPY